MCVYICASLHQQELDHIRFYSILDMVNMQTQSCQANQAMAFPVYLVSFMCLYASTGPSSHQCAILQIAHAHACRQSIHKPWPASRAGDTPLMTDRAPSLLALLLLVLF